MNISLFYVQGISRMDEPVFDTIANQRKFFVSKRVASLEQAFYPPHYQDRIKLEIGADISLNEAVNYLSLSFGGKDYYYFIDNLVYINEGVLEIGVTLDAIQTFMFNIHFINSDVSRKSIKRWNGSQINREYIRENAGEQLFKTIEYRENFCKMPYYGLLIKCIANTNEYKISINNYTDYGGRLYTFSEIKTVGQVSSKGNICDQYVYFLLPMLTNEEDKLRLDAHDATYMSISQLYENLLYLQELDVVQEINVVSGVIFNELGINVTEIEEDGHKKYTFDAAYTLPVPPVTPIPAPTFPVLSAIERLDGTVAASLLIAVGTPLLPVHDTNVFYPFSFVKNENIGVSFNKRYCPQLLDENYYQVSFGEKMSYTAYPLHKLTGTTIYCHYQLNFGDNIRTYYITDTPIKGSEYDIYLTLIQNRSLENLVLFNNPYKDYIAQNYATLTRGVALAKQQNLYSEIVGLVGGGVNVLGSAARTATNAVAGNPLGFVGGVTGITGSITQMGTSIADFYEKDYVIDEKIGIIKDNLSFKPDTVKQGNSASADILSAVLYPFYKIEEDINIVHAAEVFESYGYKVHEVTEANLFYLNLRYYYDVIQCDDMEIELTNYINDLSTINSIKARFNMGLRLWHTDNGVLRLDLGKVCYYDNVEQ